MSEYIEVGQPLQFTDPNTPTRVGEIVENVSDIYNIPSPRLGMQVFVKNEKKSFVITSLKSKTIGGVDVPEAAVEAFEPVGAKSFTWNNDTDPSNMNDFVVAGVYDIKGEHTREDDNLPILNTGGGHTFNARLTVLDSSITGSGNSDDKCITQVLSFCNRLGQGEVYIRTGKGSSLDSLTWEKWSTLQRNANVGQVDNLDNLKDNGIYSGVWTKGSYNAYPLTFVCIVINDYFVGVAPRRISQFVYGLSKFDGSTVYQSRVWDDSKNAWGDWEILNQKEISSMISAEIKKVTDGIDPEKIDSIKDIVAWIDAHGGDVTAIYNAIQQNTVKINAEVNRATNKEQEIGNKLNEETKRAQNAEQALGMALQNGLNQEATARDNLAEEIKSNAMQYDTLGVYVRADKAEIYGRSIDTTPRVVEFPAATTEKAGVMSAEDKKKVNASIKDIVVNPNVDDVELDLEDNTEKTSHVVFPAATTEKAGVMSAEDKKRMAACNSYLVNDASNLQDAINTLNNILPNEDKVSGVMVSYVDENGSLRSFAFSSNVGGFINPKRWIDIAANQTYIVDDKPADRYRLSELIENIKVQADGEFDVNATYSIGQFGYAPSFGSNIAEIKKNGTRLGIIYFNNSLVGELDASNLKIVVSVKSFGLTEGLFDYSQYNRINPQLFIDAYESWKLNAIEAVSNKNTTAIADLSAEINSVKDVVYESDIVAVDTIVQQGKYYNSLGRLVDDSSRCCTVPFDVVAGERYYITCRIGGSAVIAYVAMWGADGEWLGVADGFIGGSDDAVDREFIVPEGVEKVAVSSYNTTSPSVTKSIHSNITAYYTKRETYNRSEIDILISNSPSGGGGSDVINNVETISFNVEDNAITEAVVLGTGWSGDLTNGYVHASGNSEPLEFNLPYASGDKFVLEFKCDGVKGDSTDLLIAVGDTPTVKSYNGTSEFRIGFVANGGRLKITPASNFASTITNISIGRISNDGNRTITINVGDVYSQANSMITAFWNVAIGSKNMTLSKLVNGSRNVAIGRNTLNSATSGNRNIAIGTFAMPLLTEAEENVAIGADTIYPLTKAFGCVGIGKATLSGTQKAEYCVAIGKQAMGTYSLSKDRTKCTAVGVGAGPSITDSCTHVGYRAGANVAGAKNTSIGYGSMAVGERSTVDITGEELTCIGYYSQIDNTEEAKTAKNSTAIGANTKITKSNQVVIGNANVEEVIIAGKRIIFHADGSVKWENI